MKTFTDETRKRMSDSAKRRCADPSWLAPATRKWKPFCTEQELRDAYESRNMTQTEIAEWYGVTLKRVQTAMRKFRIAPRRAIKRNQVGEANSSWKGTDATYQAFHYRLYALRGRPKKCEVCGTENPLKSYDWANLTGCFDDPEDYKRMCRSCHFKHDQVVRNLGQYAMPKGGAKNV